MSLYNPCECNVRTLYKNDKWFIVRSGVKQDTVISPLLFITNIDEVTKFYKRGYRQIGEGNTMVHAGDIAVWSDNRRDIEEALLKWNDALINTGLKMNVEKADIVKVSRGEEEDLVLEIQASTVKNVEVKYLGSIFSAKRNNEQETTDRIFQYSISTRALYPLLKDAWEGGAGGRPGREA